MTTKNTPSLCDEDPILVIDVPRLIATRLLVQANSGGGKSWALRRLLEQTFGHAQHIVLDPDGEYHTLREQYDYVLAGKGGDCPAEVKSAALLARRLLELGVSAIIDISELGADRALFVERFLEALMDAPRDLWHDVLVVIDEAHKFCPEGDRKTTAHAAVVDLMSRGRKRGFCGVLATQRVSKLDKSAAAEVNNKLIGRTGLDVDVERAAKEIGLHAKDARQQLARLEPGQFWVVGPAFVTPTGPAVAPVLAQVGVVETTHPDTGTSRSGRPTPPRSHVKKLLGQLADLPAEAEEEAKSVEQLRVKLRAAEEKLRDLGRAPGSADTARLEAMVAEATKQRDIARVQLADLTAWEKSTGKLLETLANGLDKHLTKLTELRNEIPNQLEAAATRPLAFRSMLARAGDVGPQPVVLPTVAPDRSDHPWRPSTDDNHPGLSRMEVAMLTVLAQHPDGLAKPKLLLHADYAAGGATSRCFARLVSEGWAEEGGGGLMITTAGTRALGGYTPLPLGDDLRRHVLSGSRLSTMEKKLFAVLCDAHPNPLSKGEVIARSGYSAGGATSRAFARLVGMDYVVGAGRGRLAAAKEMFG